MDYTSSMNVAICHSYLWLVPSLQCICCMRAVMYRELLYLWLLSICKVALLQTDQWYGWLAKNNSVLIVMGFQYELMHTRYFISIPILLSLNLKLFASYCDLLDYILFAQDGKFTRRLISDRIGWKKTGV